jgi:hypothetical protein
MGSNNRSLRRRRGEYSEGVFAETDKYAKISVHVGAVIATEFKFSLVVFEKNLDSADYIDSRQKSEFFVLADSRFGQR